MQQLAWRFSPIPLLLFANGGLVTPSACDSSSSTTTKSTHFSSGSSSSNASSFSSPKEVEAEWSSKYPTIVTAGEPILHQPAREVDLHEVKSDKVQKVIDDLISAMRSNPNDIASLSAPQIGVPLKGLYYVWKARNEACFNNIVMEPGVAMNIGLITLWQWREANKVQTAKPRADVINTRRSVPPEGYLKLNMDSGSSSTGFGMIIQSSNASLMYVASLLEVTRMDSLLTEATALRWSLNINALKNASCPPYIEAIIHDCKLIASRL